MDLGANVGFTLIYYKKKFADSNLACVEPIEENIDQLRKNLKHNTINAHVFHGAISIVDGFADMELGEKDCLHHVKGFSDNAAMGNANKKIVKAYSMETILRTLHWDKIDLLKIDIEGYEEELLLKNNEWLQKVNVMIMEIHSNFKLNDLYNLAEKNNFNIIQHSSGNWVLTRKNMVI